MLPTKCDKCNSAINNQRCECGYWFNREEEPEFINCLDKAMSAYDFQYDQNKIGSPLSGMIKESHTCLILFKGNERMCATIKRFIRECYENNVYENVDEAS